MPLSISINLKMAVDQGTCFLEINGFAKLHCKFVINKFLRNTLIIIYINLRKALELLGMRE